MNSEQVKRIKSECNHAKSELIEQLRKLEHAGAAKATVRGLESVITKLEIWQNRGKR